MWALSSVRTSAEEERSTCRKRTPGSVLVTLSPGFFANSFTGTDHLTEPG